jgi:NAD(P)-dependent dehydrogenase (short-subunit alcohol dehydrogenase family)
LTHCEGRVAIVTGAAHGIGREHAIELARHGALVVVNDIGGDVHGQGADQAPAHDVVAAIRQAGGEAIASFEDVSDFAGAGRLVQTAIDHFGGLHVLVNNAGILRDRMAVNMAPEEWDTVIQVHLRGTFGCTRHAAAYWRDRHKQGRPVSGRIINTSSASGLYGNVGQSNYGAAKAGIAAFTVIAAKELARYGVTVNAIAPGALTRMTENLGTGERARARAPEEFDSSHPANIAPLVVWLGSSESAAITGRVFNVRGGHVSVAEGWHAGPSVDKGSRWEPGELGTVVPDLVAKAAPNANMLGEITVEA